MSKKETFIDITTLLKKTDVDTAKILSGIALCEIGIVLCDIRDALIEANETERGKNVEDKTT
ncbi:hypothetical protein KKE60_07915 [Patescibacteria group bacterium]|nr:hypothetical protein [Patescibacteria group bacterium]